MSDYIRKPFSANELILRVQNILKSIREKSRLQEVFARHTSPEVMRELLGRTDDLMLSGELRQVTVMFADIRGFTRIASGAEPEQIVKELNQYLTVMSEEVIAEGGTLDQFMGDGIMAIFGAPLLHDDDTMRAVRSAIRIQTRTAELNHKRVEEGNLPMMVGIGITAGPAVVGNIGSPPRMEYTAIGDCVNMASRLQGFAGGGYVIVSEEVCKHISGQIKARPLDPANVKGKSEPVKIFSVIV